MANGMEGWAALGEAIGGGLGTPGVYDKTLSDVYSREEALQDARRARSQALIDAARLEARGAFTPEIMAQYALGDPEATAQVLAGTMGASATPDLRRLGDQARPHYLANINTAQQALGEGDFAGYNAANAAALGESFEPVRELGGAYVPSGMTIDNIHAIPTPESLSRIEQNEAQSQATLQRAGAAVDAARALADRRRRVDDDGPADFSGVTATSRGPAEGVPGSPQIASPTTDAEYAALPSGAMFIDPQDGKVYRKP